MSILMPNNVYQQLIVHCLLHLPNEACGVLLGVQASSKLTIDRFVPVPNVSLHPANEFEFDHRVWTRLIFDCHATGQHILGIVHSHPASPAIPSPEDLRTEWRNIPTHWILSCEHKESLTLRAFSYHTDETYERIDWNIQFE
jgi:proteasome lid subunit RPN8/RPN11